MINVKSEKARERYYRNGFVFAAKFDGEYVLLMHPQTSIKVRICDDGTCWMSNQKTGEYEREVEP